MWSLFFGSCLGEEFFSRPIVAVDALTICTSPDYLMDNYWGTWHCEKYCSQPLYLMILMKSYCCLWCWISSSETQGQSVGSGEKAGRKFSSKGERAPGYRLSPDHFQKFKRMPAPDWAQKMLCIIMPNRRIHLIFFRVFVHDGYCLDHGLSGSCTKEMHAVRKLSVWYKILSARKLKRFFQKYKLTT